jgi:hypothetical protein
VVQIRVIVFFSVLFHQNVVIANLLQNRRNGVRILKPVSRYKKTGQETAYHDHIVSIKAMLELLPSFLSRIGLGDLCQGRFVFLYEFGFFFLGQLSRLGGTPLQFLPKFLPKVYHVDDGPEGQGFQQENGKQICDEMRWQVRERAEMLRPVLDTGRK